MEENKYKKIIFNMAEWGNTISSLLFLQKEVCRLNNWSYSEVWQLDQNKKFMIWAGYWSSNDNNFEKFSKYSSYFKFANGIGIIGKAWKKKQLLICEDLSSEQAFLRFDIAVRCRLNSMVTIPIFKEDIVTNIISFYFEKISENLKQECSVIFDSLMEYSTNKIP